MEQRDRSVPGTQAQRAVFAGGCFWCMEGPFHAMPGVLTVTPGYTGGTTANPGYDEVCAREGLVAYLPRCEAFSTHGDTT